LAPKPLVFDKLLAYVQVRKQWKRRLKIWQKMGPMKKKGNSPEKSSPKFNRLVKIFSRTVQHYYLIFHNDSVAAQNYGPYTEGFIQN